MGSRRRERPGRPPARHEVGIARLHDDRGNLELASAECIDERIDHMGVEIGAGALDDDLFGLERRHGFALWTIARQRVIDIRHRDDARLDRNLVAAIGMVSGAVELIVM
jgi:hypothetical protein